jgi:hypothetical protein
LARRTTLDDLRKIAARGRIPDVFSYKKKELLIQICSKLQQDEDIYFSKDRLVDLPELEPVLAPAVPVRSVVVEIDSPMLDVRPRWEILAESFFAEHKEFKMVPTTGDGNCMYNALSMSLYNDEKSAHQLRLDCALFAEKKKRSDPVFVSLVNAICTTGFDDWLAGIRGTDWGDHLALSVLVEAKKMNVVVYSTSSAGTSSTNHLFSETARIVNLLHADNHYMLLANTGTIVPMQIFKCTATGANGGPCPHAAFPNFRTLIQHVLMHRPEHITEANMEKLSIRCCKDCHSLYQSETFIDGLHVSCPGKPDLAGVPTNLDQLMTFSIPLLTSIPVPLVDEVAALAATLLMKITPSTDYTVS